MKLSLFKQLLLTGVMTASICTFTPSTIATEAPVKYDLITSDDATKGAVPITFFFGKIISIDFTDVGEYITFIAPSDKSKFVYNSDLPVETGEAQSIYFLSVKEIDFRGTYQTSHPNIIVKTVNGLGESKQYNFIANFSSGVMTSTGIKIVPPSVAKSPLESGTIRVSAGQTINADAVEHGLRIAIAKQFVPSTDPLINNVRNFVFMLRNGHSVNDAIVATGVSPSVIESLGEMYLEAELPPRLRKNEIAAAPQSNSNYGENLGYLEPLVEEIEQESDLALQNKLYQVLEELKDGKHPRQTIEKHKLSPKWFGKIMKAYLAQS